MNYKISNGFDYFKRINLYQVVGVDNDYIGEWHTEEEAAEAECQSLQVSFENYEALPVPVQNLIFTLTESQITPNEFDIFIQKLKALGYTAEYSMCGGVSDLALLGKEVNK